MSNDPIIKLDEFAKRSPVDFDMICTINGRVPDLSNDAERLAFFELWAKVNYEFAKAMQDERTELLNKLWC